MQGNWVARQIKKFLAHSLESAESLQHTDFDPHECLSFHSSHISFLCSKSEASMQRSLSHIQPQACQISHSLLVESLSHRHKEERIVKKRYLCGLFQDGKYILWFSFAFNVHLYIRTFWHVQSFKRRPLSTDVFYHLVWHKNILMSCHLRN